MRSSVLVSLTAAAGGVIAQQPAFGQCGGTGWSGSTSCVSGFVCTVSNPCKQQLVSQSAIKNNTHPNPSPQVFSQCIPIPGSALTLTTTLSSSAPSTTLGGDAGGAGYPGTTLQSGYYWIRAVEAPNFHKYLQTKPEYASGIAYLDSYTTAGQFQIVSGQLVQLTANGVLYGNVIPNTTAAVKLQLAFNTTQNTFGTFAFSGDSVQWSTPTITRPNLSAWLVCANQSLWINLGNYGYMTPSGCVDETIHYYNAATANS